MGQQVGMGAISNIIFCPEKFSAFYDLHLYNEMGSTWSDDYEDVKAEAENIYTRLADKTMPPDSPWSDDDIASFKQWIDDGCLP